MKVIQLERARRDYICETTNPLGIIPRKDGPGMNPAPRGDGCTGTIRCGEEFVRVELYGANAEAASTVEGRMCRECARRAELVG